MGYLMGIDIGTQGTKAVLADREGNILNTGYRGYDLINPGPLRAEQEAGPWVEAVYAVIKDLMNDSDIAAEIIKGIAISSLYGGSGIPVDNNIKPLSPALIWMDRRANKEVAWVKENIDPEKLFRITGNTVDSYYGFTKMMWIKNNRPDIWQQMNLFLPPNSFVIYRLTGEIAIDYSSAGNIGGIFDIRDKRWSEEMCTELGIPVSCQPQRLVASDEIVGEITARAAANTGLKKGTPVIAGGIDAAVATLSAGVFSEGSHVAMLGTSMCWGFVTEKINLSSRLVSMPNVIEPLDRVYMFGGAATAGAVVRWFRDVLGQEEVEAGEKVNINPYTLLEIKARDIPAGSEGLLVLPYFMGERSPIWDSEAKGTIMGLSLYHGKAHLYRAFMEGVAYALRHNMESVKDTEIDLDREMIMVGGASKSTIWPQICADVTGYPVKIVKNGVEAPIGDVLLAGLGTGEIEKAEVIKDWLEYEQIIEPDEANKGIYDKYFLQYRQIYENTRENMHKLNEII